MGIFIKGELFEYEFVILIIHYIKYLNYKSLSLLRCSELATNLHILLLITMPCVVPQRVKRSAYNSGWNSDMLNIICLWEDTERI